jgi:hypothetical protein
VQATRRRGPTRLRRRGIDRGGLLSAVELYDDALDRLGRGDEVGAAESLKTEALANSELLEQQITAELEGETGNAEGRVQAFLADHDEVNERLLASAFPVIEYGSERLLSALARSAAPVVRPSAQVRSGSALRPSAAAVVAARVLWAMATYALFCARTEALAVLDSITIRPPDEDREGVPAFGRMEFRYPNALSGNAGNSYEHYRSWLGARPLVSERLALFATQLDDIFAETDLLLALRLISVQRRAYSGGAEPPTVRRLADRFRDVRQRPGLAALFRVGDDKLDELVESCYRQGLEYDHDRFWGGLPAAFLVPDTEA